MTTSALLCSNYDCSDEQHVCSQARALSGTILVARPLMFWLLNWICLLKFRLGTADPGDTQAPWPHRLPVNGIKTARDTRLDITPGCPPTHHLSKNIHTCRCHKAHAHTHTHTPVNHLTIVRVLTLWIWYVPSIVSPFPSFHISLNSSQVRGSRALIPRGSPRSHLGPTEGPSQASRR